MSTIVEKKYMPLKEPIPIRHQQWGEGILPLVSISCVTYNHAPYINEAIEGFLMQKTDFPVEILIHDDASTDGTLELIQQYEKQYPHLIFPMYQKENQYSRGARGMMVRFNFPRARGKYIALCEGDDYWTSDLKLKTQVDFLEKNPEYSMCFHKVKTMIDHNLQDDKVLEERYQAIADQSKLTTLDLLKAGNFIHTGSVLMRNQILNIPFEYYKSPVGDYFLFILLSEAGYMYRVNEYMGVYRRGSGIYSKQSPLEMQRLIVRYHIAILSYLSNEEHKSVFLQKTFSAIEKYEYLLSSEEISIEKMAANLSAAQILKILWLKTKLFLTRRSST